jgi:hypothetical protein
MRFHPDKFNQMFRKSLLAGAIILAFGAGALTAGEPSPRGPLATTWDEVYARMHPWRGTHAAGSDPATLEGKIMAGYQGWFLAEGDGSGRGWVHYGRGVFEPGNCTVDMLPDMRDCTPAERYPTEFRNADGGVVSVFSSYNAKTVDRHFQWMQEYGIDGVFLQRFGTEVSEPQRCDFRNAVLDSVRDAANRHGRTWAVMYDLSGMSGLELRTIIMKDWKTLVDRMEVTQDPSYQHYKGRPLVALWGVGFNDGRKYSTDDVLKLMDFLKNDPKYGGNAIMLGVPYGWREGIRDSLPAGEVRRLVDHADIISPWSVTRYASSAGFLADMPEYQEKDMASCSAKGVGYMPVIFPGFSWRNLMLSRHDNASWKPIPRDHGSFLWTQGSALAKAGAKMIYVAMFDEIDEGTAIFKVTNDPPMGKSRFVTYDGDPSDLYMRLAGKVGALLHRN